MLKRRIDAGKRYVFKTHINDILLPREEAEVIEAFRVVIEPGKYTHAHVHEDTEQLYCVISGEGRAIYTSVSGVQTEFTMAPGEVVHVPRNIRHQIFCTSAEEPLIYLCVDGFPLGKPQNEPTWDSHYEAVMQLPSQQPEAR